jgi:hypothetical protein
MLSNKTLFNVKLIFVSFMGLLFGINNIAFAAKSVSDLPVAVSYN